MASYGNTVLTSAGIDLVKRVIAKTATFEITKVATSSDSRLTNATISAIEAMTSLPSVNQNGKVTAFDTSNSKQVGLKCEFTNQGLTNPYNICGVGIYAKEAGKSEILFAVAPAKEPETMPAKPNGQSALFAFSLNMYVVVGQASSMSITATTEGVVKSINSTIKPDANGNVTMSYYSQAEVDQKISSLSSMIDSLNSSKTSNTDFNALKNRVAANESGKADKTSVYDKETADGRYLQRDASTTLKSGSVLRWDDSGHANDDNNVPYTAGGLRWSGKTDNVEIKAEETAVDNLDLVFNLGDDGSNNVDFRWNNVSKAKINSSGKFTGHVDWANVDGKDTYSRAEIDSKVNAAKAEAYDKSTSDIRFVNTSGDTMSGNLVLDSSHHLEHLGGVVNFSKSFEYQSSINSLINALGPLTGCSGSFNLAAQDGVLNTGWYNFIWMPHREGGITGGDNGAYGTMLLVPFGGGSAWIVNYYDNRNTSIKALAWDENLATTTNTANAAKAKAEANANSIQALSAQTTTNTNSIQTISNNLAPATESFNVMDEIVAGISDKTYKSITYTIHPYFNLKLLNPKSISINPNTHRIYGTGGLTTLFPSDIVSFEVKNVTYQNALTISLKYRDGIELPTISEISSLVIKPGFSITVTQ